MLAQNFKTPADLGLLDTQHRALITVLGMLERGEIVHNKDGEHIFAEDIGAPPTAFNMYHVYAEAECGTVCCLAGWAEFVGGFKPFSIFGRARLGNAGLTKLFDPYFGPYFSIRNITPAHAALALRSFLTTGEPDWESALCSALNNGRK